MPILQLNPIAEIAPQPEPVQVKKSDYQGIVADVQQRPVSQMLAYLEGMPWSVDYYGQMLGKHSDLRDLDPGQNAAFQQYRKINGLELRVQSSLQSTYNEEEGVTDVTGSSIVIHVVPNKADYFVAEAGNRQTGLYQVTSVERRSFNVESVYLVNYRLVAYVTPDNVLFTDLESKVVRQYYFSKDRLVDGLAPVIRKEDYEAYMDYLAMFGDWAKTYYRTFFCRGQMTLLVPMQPRTIYDAWLVDFLRQIVSTDDAPEVRQMSIISLDHDQYMAQGCLWTSLLLRSYSEMQRVHSKASLAPRCHFNRSSWLKGAVYWNVDEYVYPVLSDDYRRVPTQDQRIPYYAPAKFEYKVNLESPEYAGKNQYVLPDGTVIPLAYSVTYDDYYVLSEHFYRGDARQSVLELLVRDYLKSATLDRKMLNAVLMAYPDWPILERFYFGPLLLLLLKDVVRGIY